MRGTRQLLALFGTHCANVSDQRHLAFRFFGNNFQYLLSLNAVLDKCLTRRPTDIQPVDPLPNVETHQAAQALNVQSLLAIGVNNAGITPFKSLAIATSDDD